MEWLDYCIHLKLFRKKFYQKMLYAFNKSISRTYFYDKKSYFFYVYKIN